MSEFKETRVESSRTANSDSGSSPLHRELEASASSIVDHLKRGSQQELNVAMIEFRNEILKLEKMGGKDVAANERDFLRALTTQQDDLKLNGLGFPKFHLTENGEQLTFSAEVKEKNGTVDSTSYHFDWTSFTKQENKQHPVHGGKEFTSSDFMQSLQPKLDPAASTEAPPVVPQQPERKGGPLVGAVEDQQINLSAGQQPYGAPKMVYDGSVQAQQHFSYTGDVPVPGDVIHITAHDTCLPKTTQWMDVTGSSQYHSAYGYFEEVKDGRSQQAGQPRREIFHMLQVSRYDAAHAPGRPVTEPPRGTRWAVELDARPE